MNEISTSEGEGEASSVNEPGAKEIDAVAVLLNGGQYSKAAALTQDIVDRFPLYWIGWAVLAAVLKQMERFENALVALQKAVALSPGNADLLNNLGVILRDVGRPHEAERAYRRAIEIMSDFSEAYVNLGCFLMEIGKTEEGERLLTKAIELAPNAVRPLAAAITFLPYHQDDPRFSQLDTVYAQRESLPLEERIKLNFSLGRAMESIGQYDRSFYAYQEGNRLFYQEHPFNEAEDKRFLDESCRFFTADLFQKYAVLSDTLPSKHDERVPIFIIGMPRSGTTLIEQILASHPSIFGAGELKMPGYVAHKAASILRNTQDGETALLALRNLGGEYLDDIWKRSPNALYIINKMPSNYRHLGLIHLMLPKAKIIHALRDPMDTCFSCYALLFKDGHTFSYELKMLGRYYLRYIALMKHWKKVLPTGWFLDLRYENNVANPEREARRMLDYLGLPWEPACLNFYTSRRTIHTASVSQVRKPIYANSIGRWTYFEKHVGPLLETLQTEGNDGEVRTGPVVGKQ